VEDGSDSRELLSRLLRQVGFEVMEAENGEQGVYVYEKFHPHLIWMDIRMPIMNGYEAVKKIRSQSTADNQPAIIALTASAFEEEKILALKKGCDDFVRKPFKIEEIFEKMSDQIGVQYLYKKTKKKTASAKKLSKEDIISLLQSLPEKIIQKLQEAVELSDGTMINNVIGRIRPQDKNVARALNTLAANFEYEEISNLILKVKKD
jgi:CheY-like chemotaxis protein